jgi:hypothetical protein
MLGNYELWKISVPIEKEYYCNCVVRARDVVDYLAEGKSCTLARCIILVECVEQIKAMAEAKLYDCSYWRGEETP